MVPFKSIQSRVARPASARRNVAKTLAQIVVMWSIFYGFVPAAVYRLENNSDLRRFRFSSPGWRVAGSVLFLMGGTLGLTSAWFMVLQGKGTPLPADCPRELVIAGPYRHVRNPMAMGSFAQGIAVGLFLGSPMVTAYALIGAVGWNYTVRPWEEHDLERRFGAPYRHYRTSVRCWIPHLQAYAHPRARAETPATTST